MQPFRNSAALNSFAKDYKSPTFCIPWRWHFSRSTAKICLQRTARDLRVVSSSSHHLHHALLGLNSLGGNARNIALPRIRLGESYCQLAVQNNNHVVIPHRNHGFQVNESKITDGVTVSTNVISTYQPPPIVGFQAFDSTSLKSLNFGIKVPAEV